jgi:hypothetical protein
MTGRVNRGQPCTCTPHPRNGRQESNMRPTRLTCGNMVMSSKRGGSRDVRETRNRVHVHGCTPLASRTTTSPGTTTN